MKAKTAYKLAYRYFRAEKAYNRVWELYTESDNEEMRDFGDYLATVCNQIWTKLKHRCDPEHVTLAFNALQTRDFVENWEKAYSPGDKVGTSLYRGALNWRREYGVARFWWKPGWVYRTSREIVMLVLQTTPTHVDDIPF